MKPIMYKNRLNGDLFICENVRDTHQIDGVEYLAVHRPGQTRTFLMRRDALERVAKMPQPH